jgi:hypothetical protein
MWAEMSMKTCSATARGGGRRISLGDSRQPAGTRSANDNP